MDLFLLEIKMHILNLIRKFKGSRIAKTTLKKNQVIEPMVSDFKTYYKAIIIKSI